MKVKTIVLYNVRMVRPETWDKIREAKNGECIGIEPSEMGAFQCLNIFIPDDVPSAKPKPAKKK